MITARDHYSGSLFDPWAHLGSKRRALLEASWAGLVRQHLLGVLPVSRLAPFFNSAMGRPGKDLHVAMGALVLQQLHDLSDAATVEAIAFNEAWHYALDARGEDDMYLCERTLRNYRSMVVAGGLDEILFRSLTDQLIKVFDVDPSRQRIDSTALRSNMAKLTRLGVLCETIEMFLRELCRHDAGLYARVDAELLGRHGDGKQGCFGVARPSEAKRRLPQAAADLLLLARAFAGTSAAELPGYALVQRVLQEQCEVTNAAGEGEKLRVRENEELGGDVLQNPSDPDSTYNAHKGQGYTVQLMETFTPHAAGEEAQSHKPDIITHVAVGKMTGHDKDAVLPALQDTAARGIAPKELSGDGHYGVQENLDMARAWNVELIAPAQPPAGSQQDPPRFSLEQFILQPNGQVKQCPAGHAPVAVSTSEKGTNYQARFDAATCHACALRPQCPVQNPRGKSDRTTRLQYKQERLPMRERRLAEEEPAFKERYRWRAGIEATMSRYKHQIGCAALRVRGKAAVAYEAFMGALGLNIFRCARCAAAMAEG
jgi:Transposase DDE domain/Transposase domain (DUF772)